MTPAAPSPASTFFTFKDGALTYDCDGCGACCKGLGIGFARNESHALLHHYPALARFLRTRGETEVAFNPRGGCWFLQPDGLCRVEVEHGRSTKPSACRHFPFNRVFRAGDRRVVDVNTVICPLRPAKPGQGIRHQDLLLTLEQDGDALIEAPLAAAPALLDAEAAFSETCFGASSLQTLLSPTQRDPAESAIQAVFERPATAPGDLEAALLVLPSLRFNEIFGPRKLARDDDWAVLLPAMARAWLDLAGRGEQLAQRPLDLRDLTTLWSDSATLCALLARWHLAPILPAGPVQFDGPNALRADFMAAARAFHDNRRARRPLGALLAPWLADTPIARRGLHLRLLAPLLPSLWFRTPA